MSAETMKMPDPIIDPTTRLMAASGPMPRMNSDGGDVTGSAWVSEAMGVFYSLLRRKVAGLLLAAVVRRCLDALHRLFDDCLACGGQTLHDLRGTVHQAHGSCDRLNRQL